MSKGNSLIQKVKRKEKRVRKRLDSDWKRADKVNKLSDVLNDSVGPWKLMRGIQRRLDKKLGKDTVANSAKSLSAINITATTVERFDFDLGAGFDYGIRLTLSAPVLAFAGFQAGDVVQVMNGAMAGKWLNVVSIPDSTHVRLEDVASFAYAGLKETSLVVCEDDVAGSLDGTYIVINSAANATSYYVWFDVDAGGNDPLVVGKTAIPVAIASNDVAADIASAMAAAIAAQADFDASSVGPNVVITNAAVGIATDIADTGLTGFVVSVSQQGAAASPLNSESNKVIRLELSSEKPSYK